MPHRIEARQRPATSPRRTARCALLAVGLSGLLLGCSGRKEASIYVHENADLYAFEKVAILPIDNLTSDRFAGEKVREILALELASLGAFDVLDLGEVNRTLRVLNMNDVSVLGPEQVGQVGETLEVDGLLMGAVIEYREQRSGNLTSPDVALALRLLDVETGIVVWSVGDAERGMGVWTRLFGVGGESQTEAVRELVRDLMLALYQGA